MNKVLIIFLIIGLYSCGEKRKMEKSVSGLNNFELIQDFEKNKTEFRTDTFELNNHSADGGELKVFHNNNKTDYIVLDFWLYGETGRLNYIYWTDKKLNFKIVKKLNYEYDKPYYVDGFKTDSTIHFLSYSNSKTNLFDINKTEVTESEQIEKTKSELESFFRDVTKGIEIIK